MIAIDNSTLSAVQTCSTQAALRYVLGLAASEDAGPQRAGSAAHAAWAAWFRSAGDATAALAALEAEYKAWADEHIEDPDDRLAYANVRAIMHQWFTVHTTASLPVYVPPTLVEIGFAVPLDGDFVFVGRMDALGQTESGAWQLVEHKAQPLSARVVTPTGFVPIGTLVVGSRIIGRDGKTYSVVGVYPQGVCEAYRVRFTDGGETRCSKDHRWTVLDRRARPHIVTTEFLQAARTDNLRLPALSPVEFDAQSIPISGYLLGVLLGDGHFASHSVQLSTASLEQVELIRAVLPAGMIVRKAGGKNYSWSINGGKPGVKQSNVVMNAIRQLGLENTRSWSKFVPDQYKYGCVSERLAVLQGLLDTDGNVYHGHVSYTSVSERLALDVVELVRSLGGVARMNKRSGTKRPAYTVRVRLEAMPVFRLTSKRNGLRPLIRPESRILHSVEPCESEQMVCIQTSAPDGLYVTDDYIVTHNTTGNLDDRWRRTHRSAAQITGYTFAAQHHVNAPVVGALINGVEFSKLPSSERKCRFHNTTYSACRLQHAKFEAFVTERPPHLHAAWLETAIDLARRFVALRDRVQTVDDLHAKHIPTEGQFTGACTRCPFNDYCRMGRPTAPAQVDAQLRLDPWSPYQNSLGEKDATT